MEGNSLEPRPNYPKLEKQRYQQLKDHKFLYQILSFIVNSLKAEFQAKNYELQNIITSAQLKVEEHKVAEERKTVL
jgi:hypothetical protein